MRYLKLSMIAILVVFLPGLVEARWSVTPRLSVGAEYDDNLFLTEENEQDDLFYTISPGIDLSYETPTELIDLDYEFRRYIYSDFTELDFSEHRGRLEARKDFGARWSAGIRDFLISSQDPIQLYGIREFETPSIRIGDRNQYLGNVLEPDITYRFGEDRSFRIGYRNQILRNEADDIADLDVNAINGLLDYRFSVRSAVAFFYQRVLRDYGSTDPPRLPRDNTEDQIWGRYTLDFNPRTSGFFEYRYRHVDYDTESPAFFDYDVHTPNVGFYRDLRENVSLSAQGGYDLRVSDVTKNQGQFFGLADFRGSYDRLTVSLYGETGLGEQLTGTENFGFNEFWRVGLNGTYQFGERFWVDGFLYFLEEDFTDIDRRDKYWNVRGRLRYQVFRWLFASLEYVYNRRDSTASFQSFTDNRIFGRLTGQYDIAERYQ